MGTHLGSHSGDSLECNPLPSGEENWHPDEVLSRQEVILLSASFIAVLIFACVGIQRWVWLDEANSVLIALRGPRGIVSSLAVDNNLPCY
jgi:hypothetical protein